MKISQTTTNPIVTSKHSLKFKQHYKSLVYYSMPSSTLFALRKRVHFILYITLTVLVAIFTFL